jgi:hypothetical protein
MAASRLGHPSTTRLPYMACGARSLVDWTWTFVLEDMGNDETRLLLRCRGKGRPYPQTTPD